MIVPKLNRIMLWWRVRAFDLIKFFYYWKKKLTIMIILNNMI